MVPEAQYAQGSDYDDEALQEVIAMEKEAQAIIRDAEQQARRLVADARKRRDQLLADSRETAEREGAARMAAEQETTKAQVVVIERETEQDVADWLRVASGRVDEILTHIVQVVAFGKSE